MTKDIWRWIVSDVVYAIHDQILARYGGPDGVRDVGAIESALARPKNHAVYGVNSDIAVLAAACLYGLARNHGFADGNKRTAWVAARLFLADHDYVFKAKPHDVIRTVEKTAAGEITQEELAQWFRERISK